MHVNGRKKTWESKEKMPLIWDNILSLKRNFLTYGNDVVIDYVTFPQEAGWVRENLRDLDVNVKYVVLWTDNDTLIKRDNIRKPEDRMGERCLILISEFKSSGLDDKHLFDSRDKTTKDIDYVIEQIINNQKYNLT
jgi:hypothetical protein